ncbi:YraN family protein [Bacteroidia bacterium]|jgi:putative endonuclease|nr:YraN family protein [Bacteroidia bacterium]
MKTQKQILGQEGENIAIRHLINQKYKILARNFRDGYAEIDIIATDNHELIVVEVKTRNSSKYGEPEESVSTKKQQLLSQAIEAYMEIHELKIPVRFDIISIIKNQYKTDLNHIKDAFWPGLY